MNRNPFVTLQDIANAFEAKESRIFDLERERDGLKIDLDERTRQVAQLQDDLTDARNALRLRPVVEGEEARRLREAWAKAPLSTREYVANSTWSYWGGMELVRAMRAFCESQPPTESVAGLVRERCEMQREIAELKQEVAAPKAAPISAAPALDEYTKAAVTYAEAVAEHVSSNAPIGSDVWHRFRPLYETRKRGEAGADHLRDAAKKVEPAPAPPWPRETVTVMVYVHRVRANSFRPCPAEIVLFSRDCTGGEYECIGTLAIDARVVREGGAA